VLHRSLAVLLDQFVNRRLEQTRHPMQRSHEIPIPDPQLRLQATQGNTIDIAAKIVRTSGKTILKIRAATWKHLHIEELWLKSGHPPHFAWAVEQR